MPYQRNTWARGDTITSAKLNNIEQGIADLSDTAGSNSDLNCIVADHTNVLDRLETSVNQMLGVEICTNIRNGEGTGAVIEGLLEDYVAPGYSVEMNDASGDYAHAEGFGTVASGVNAHAEGRYNTSSGEYAHTEGNSCVASGQAAHAEGSNTVASGGVSHAEGGSTDATGLESHAEGFATTASGSASHAEGSQNVAAGNFSHAEGRGTYAKFTGQHVFGTFNQIDPKDAEPAYKGNYVEIVGNGLSDGERSNARTLDWDGNEGLAGSLTLGVGTADEVTVTAAQLKALLALLS